MRRAQFDVIVCFAVRHQVARKSSESLPPTSTDVCELFGISGIPMIVIVHPDGESHSTLAPSKNTIDALCSKNVGICDVRDQSVWKVKINTWEGATDHLLVQKLLTDHRRRSSATAPGGTK